MGKTMKTRSTRLTDLRLADRLREDDLRKAEAHRIDDIRHITNKANRRAGKAEAHRIDAAMQFERLRVDANRAGDVAAVALANTRAEMTASNLQEKASDSATALATQVETVAKVAATAVEGTTHSLVARIEPLEQLRWSGGGAKEQRQETKADFKWTFNQVLAVLGLAAGLIYFLLQTSP